MQSLQNLPKVQNFMPLMSAGESSVNDRLRAWLWPGDKHTDRGMSVLLPENRRFVSALLKHSAEIFGIYAVI